MGIPKWVIGLAIGGVVLLAVIIVAAMAVSYKNKEVRLRKTIEAKQLDNKSEFDNMWKKIKQVAQVTDEAKNALIEIFQKHAEARSGGQKGGSLMLWVKESIPDAKANTDLYKNLMNILTSSRDSWTMRQKELIGLKNEYDVLCETIPSAWFVTKRDIEITIITSSKTERTFEEGKDDDVDLFPSKEEEEEEEK
jgi:hypothetical protein